MGGGSVLVERPGEILEEVLVPAGALVEDQIAANRPGVQAPGTEELTVFEADCVAGRAVRAIIGNGHVA